MEYPTYPKTKVAIKIYELLKRCEEASPGIMLSREQILSHGMKNGESRFVILSALREIEHVIRIASIWGDNTMWYGYNPLSDKEVEELIEGYKWFDSLP